MRNERGFTLLELMIAGSASVVVVLTAFVALSTLQRNAARQSEADQVVSEGRLALEVIARDIRGAGDALDLLPSFCVADADRHDDASFSCPAVLEPHPWRVVLARNAWNAAGGGRSRAEVGDDPPPLVRAFTDEPENVVAYRFVQTREIPALADGTGATRHAYLGRIERVVNPYGFPVGSGAKPVVTVLLENVLLDDRMRTNPAVETDVDHRYDHSLFMYQVLTTTGEFQGAIAARTTSTGGPFLTPPLRFFPIGDPGDFRDESPWAQDFDAEVVGLEADATTYAGLLATGSAGMKASEKASDLRLLLDRNRIRAVRVAFKVVGPERIDVGDGLDIDPDHPGLAPVYAFETTAEIKPLAHELEP